MDNNIFMFAMCLLFIGSEFVIQLYILFDPVVGYLISVRFEKIKIMLGWLFIIAGLLIILPGFGRRELTSEGGLMLVFGAAFILLGVSTFIAFNKIEIPFDAAYEAINSMKKIEFLEADRTTIIVYILVDDLKKIAKLFEGGIYSTNEFKHEKEKWLSRLSSIIYPTNVPELLIELLPFMNNHTLEEEEITAIKKLAS